MVEVDLGERKTDRSKSTNSEFTKYAINNVRIKSYNHNGYRTRSAVTIIARKQKKKFYWDDKKLFFRLIPGDLHNMFKTICINMFNFEAVFK